MARYRTIEGTLTTTGDFSINGLSQTGDVLETLQITCDGMGDIGVKFDFGDGSFGDTHTLKPDETIKITSKEVDEVRLLHSGTDSDYRIIAY